MKTPVVRHVYGTWAACMTVVRKCRMKNRKKELRLYDRYDIEPFPGELMRGKLAPRRGKTNLMDGVLTSTLNWKTFSYDTEYFHMTLYKD